MVRAGRVSATWIDAVRQRLRHADMTIRSAVLVDTGPRQFRQLWRSLDLPAVR